MDPTVQFFAKLKKLAAILETETASLQHTFENRNKDVDGETQARGVRAFHELNCEVGDLKGQIQAQLAEQKTRTNEVSRFINACRVTEQRVSQDIQTMKEHWEKYGYQAPQHSRKKSSAKGLESAAEDEAAGKSETQSAGGEEGGSQEEEEAAGCSHPSSPLAGGPPPPPVPDVLRTPQLSDFGLSEMQLQRALAGDEWCAEVPPMPAISHALLSTPKPPPMPITPKCALRMDDDELLTPQMNDFGISEHTMCLINDFTMDLLQKKVEKPQRAPQDLPVAPVSSVMESFQAKDNLESPEPPVFCTPGFNIKKTKSRCSPPAQSSGDPESPGQPRDVPTTPEMPAFQTPYLKHLVSAKKSARQPEPIDMQADDDSHIFELPTPPRNGLTSSKHIRERSAPEISILGVEDKQMPEMPNLESVWANSLQNRSAKMLKKSSEHEKVTTVNMLELDGPTQEFSLGTPRLRKDFQEPCTPEMPDLSSVTQDICKLVSQAQLKKTAMAVVQPNVRAEKDNKSARPTAVSVPVVSEREFQSLPSYLRLMTLHNLNQAIHSINKFIAECPGEKTEFQMEELRRVTSVGTKTPVYVLCLTELKRLTHVGGAKNTSVYKLSTNN